MVYKKCSEKTKLQNWPVNHSTKPAINDLLAQKITEKTGTESLTSNDPLAFLGAVTNSFL